MYQALRMQTLGHMFFPFINMTLTDDNLFYIFNHVFLPPNLPDKSDNDEDCEHELILCKLITELAEEYGRCIPSDRRQEWSRIILMLKNLYSLTSGLSETELKRSINGMRQGDVLVVQIRAQNAALILRKMAHSTVFEVFEISPSNAAIMGSAGKLICSYPGPAVEVLADTVSDDAFLKELASFIVHMNVDILDSAPTTRKAGSDSVEERDTAHPRYISQLLIGILRGIGTVAEVQRITKRIADDVLWKAAFKPWRRSPLWLVIRVAIQTSLVQTVDYKSFMLFLHAKILHIFAEKEFPSDVIFCARAKAARRAHKLSDLTSDFVLQRLDDAMDATEVVLQTRWNAVQRSQATAPPWNPSCIHGVLDSQLTLPHSRDYIAKLLHPDITTTDPSPVFHPNHHQRLKETSGFRFLTPQMLEDALSADPYIALADFEMLVQDHVDEWIAQHLQDEFGVVKMAAFLDEYLAVARNCYSCNAEDQSRMILTVLEMWVMVDTLAVAQCPLLADYSPEIPATFLEPLLLRRAGSLERANHIDEYLRSRYARTTSNNSIFSDTIDATSFCIRYFEESEYLRDLMSNIVVKASDEREMKIEELRGMNASYHSLMHEASLLDYEYEVTSKGTRRVIKMCKRKQLEKQARRMRIAVHEWPLSAEDLPAKAFVFELHRPLAFARWRDSTYKILRDVGLSEKPIVPAESYAVLHQNASLVKRVEPAQPRITFASTTKSFQQSHYSRKRIPATEADICVNCGLHYRLYDKLHNEWAATSFAESNVMHYCTLALPTHGPYGYLQYTVQGTSHMSNQVIASQSECPKELSLHEHLAFAGLRSGPRLQWMNVVRELSATSLTFKCEEVHSLITQAAWQIGPLAEDGLLREWHRELTDVGFGMTLLNELDRLLQSVELNWTEVATARTIIFLAGRLLASTNSWEVTRAALDILRKTRIVTFRWMRELAEKLRSIDEAVQGCDLQMRVCDVAATCRATYDVDPFHIPFLLSSVDDTAILVECAIYLHNSLPASIEKAPSDFKKLLARDQQLSHLLELHLWEKIVQNRRGLDDAIASVWPTYEPTTTSWERLPEPNSRWLTALAATPDAGTLIIHFNLLDGELLVDGKPLGRLPRSVVKHPTYARIFGEKVLDIVPADMSDMEFATRIPVSGYHVLFALRDDNLTIKARHVESGEVFELIGHEALIGDFPSILVDGFAHWLSLSTGEIEFRPLSDPWTPSSTNWYLFFSTNKPCVMMSKDSPSRLIDIHSQSSTMIARQLQPLEYAHYLVVVYDLEKHRITVRLPRFRLSFFVTSEGKLASENFPGMVVDQHQSSGTMLGLHNQLILHAQGAAGCKSSSSRRVLIPHGKVEFSVEGHHVSVTIDTSSQDRVSYHDYRIDPDLGYLASNVNLKSKLYKILLHALCSHCLPDPLTRRTGTEEALQELRSASCLSFQSLTATEIELLRQIAALTPTRQFYPEHLRTMQIAQWSDLSPLSQHDGFRPAVQVILGYARNLSIFGAIHGDIDLSDPLDASPLLLERAARRNAIFHVDDLAAHLPGMPGDSQFRSRDIPDDTGLNDEMEASKASTMVYSLTQSTSPPLLELILTWGSKFAGPNESRLNLSYSKRWLQPDLLSNWLTVYNQCRHPGIGTWEAMFQLGFSLPAMAYKTPHLRPAISLILSFLTIPAFQDLEPPSYPSYNFLDGFNPDADHIQTILFASAVSLEHSPAAELNQKAGESLKDFNARRTNYFASHLSSQVTRCTQYLMEQWPCTKPTMTTTPSDDPFRWVDTSKCLARIHEIFESCFNNMQLRLFVFQIENILRIHHQRNTFISEPPLYRFKPSLHSARARTSRLHFTLAHVVSLSLPAIWPADSRPCLIIPPVAWKERCPEDTAILKRLLSEFRNDARDRLHHQYGKDMDRSREELDRTKIPVSSKRTVTLRTLVQYHLRCSEHVRSIFISISDALCASKPRDQIIAKAGLWPRISSRTLLGLLASTNGTELSTPWRDALISYAQATIEYQRSQRLVSLALNKQIGDLFKELDDIVSSDGAIASTNADWLLIQIDGNFIARDVQIRVAEEMVSPSSGQNSILQLNMGEGKSSVIVPMAATVLANGRTLVRIVVLKSLTAQMFQLLVKRLSGLANRRVFYMPFSRDVTVQNADVTLIRQLYEQCLREGGILLVQPEHILSFKLIGLERLFSATGCEEETAAMALLDTQDWLEDRSRDILDESDELLHVHYQLVYTIGKQEPLENHPNRWTTIQQVFSLVQRFGAHLKRRHPQEVDMHEGPEGSFPAIRITGVNAATELVSYIAHMALHGELPNLGLSLLPATFRAAALRFLTKVDIEQHEYDEVQGQCHSDDYWKGLLLLRGLLAHRVLLYVLSDKRWRVDYGLDPSRSLLAVPYRAKDIPSLRAEFGHPDVAISLTCLSYYYSGLTEDQLLQCFQLLDQGDNPAHEYELWVRCSGNIPPSLQRLDGVNTHDMEQFQRYLVPIFCKNRSVINFFLSSVVFPKQAKEYPQKISTSGWDLARTRTNVTTGFSGTNDNRHLLPTSVKQQDPVHQLNTNAQVLMYLLQLENDHYLCMHDSHNKPCPAQEFLEILVHQELEIRVLLDVGAQMLELQNRDLASNWLKLRRDVSAAIYFDETDHLTVIMQDGTTESFVSSQFNQQLDQCIVYLDDAHTRGTDLKLPRNFRAAVTLGPKVTKDRLIQGCMRMRQLGNGQSVMFCAPLEVDRRIRDAARASTSDAVKVVDILRWAMLETCEDIRHHVPHWAQQGIDYDKRRKADLAFTSSKNIQTLKDAWLQSESRTLEDLYGMRASSDPLFHLMASRIPAMRRRFRRLGVVSLRDPSIEEEQEREVSHENEQEREVERPLQAHPAKHQLYSAVRTFVRTGEIPSDSSAFASLFRPLGPDRSSDSYGPWSRHLLATADFMKTVSDGRLRLSDYLRPVHWVVSSTRNTSILVVLSPYEVDILLPDFRRSTAVRLHIYTPRVTEAMKPFDHLEFYSVSPLPMPQWTPPPRIIRSQLSLWAGQLYLGDYETYLELCAFLGIYTVSGTEGVQSDGFVKAIHRKGALIEACAFSETPVPALKELVGLRRKGVTYGYLGTHMGKILHARLLNKEDF